MGYFIAERHSFLHPLVRATDPQMTELFWDAQKFRVTHDRELCPYLRLPQRRRSAVPLMTWCPFCSHPVDSNICDCEYHTMGTLTLQLGPGLRSSHLGLGAGLCIYKCANLNLTSVSSSYHCCCKHVTCLLYIYLQTGLFLSDSR